MRGKTHTVRCVCCNWPFRARIADLARGWARTCSKTCAAKLRSGKGYFRDKLKKFEDDLADAIILGEIDVEKKK